MAIPTKAKTYDYLIVGSGAEALLTGLILQAQGLRGAVIEKEEHLGGLNRPLRYQDQMFDAHLNFWPQNETAEAALKELQKWIPDLEYSATEVGALTFHNGQVQPFMGFGEHHVPAADEYSSFAQAPQYVLSKSTAEILTALREQFTGDVLIQSEVTQIAMESAELPSLVINGAQKLSGKEIYFFENPHVLAKLLQNDSATHMSKTAVQKLAKVPLWTAVNLMFHHKQEVSQSPAVHILYGAKEQPCIGRLNQQNGLPISQWLCFLNDESAADSEVIGAAIREMKKQIKRMYPYFLDSVEKEFIFVNKNAYGTVPAALLDKNHQLPKTPHLHLGSRFYSTIPGFLGDISSVLNLKLRATSEAPSEELTEASAPL